MNMFAVPDQIVLSQPAVQRNGVAPQGLAGSGRRRTLALKNTEVTATIMASPGQVTRCDRQSCGWKKTIVARFTSGCRGQGVEVRIESLVNVFLPECHGEFQVSFKANIPRSGGESKVFDM